jgi:AhpD family alkylhydroperoxidase
LLPDALSKKQKELIAVGISFVKVCESYMQWHIAHAAKDGANFEEAFSTRKAGMATGISEPNWSRATRPWELNSIRAKTKTCRDETQRR